MTSTPLSNQIGNLRTSLPTDSSKPVVIIGAGPHGLSAAAHLRAAGLPTRVFGETLGFWQDTMPRGMFLRSSPRASNISSPDDELTLARWSASEGRTVEKLLPIGDFIDYGRWYAQQAVPDVDARLVRMVQSRSRELLVELSDGEQFAASRVVVAAGLGSFPYTPSAFQDLPASLCSHAVGAPDLERFAGRSVAVIGSGQTALESAALLHELGATVEVIARRPGIFWLGGYGWGGMEGNSILPPPSSSSGSAQPSLWRARKGLYWREAPTEVGGRLTSWVGAAPDVCRRLPRATRSALTYRCVRPAGGYWLPDRLRQVPITLGRRVLEAQALEGHLDLRLDDGETRTVDHVLLGTGYRIEVHRFPFLAPELLAQLRVKNGSPVLAAGLRSSVAGLHFSGALAAESFGPAMRFVVGTAYTGPAIAQGILGRHRPFFRWAF